MGCLHYLPLSRWAEGKACRVGSRLEESQAIPPGKCPGVLGRSHPGQGSYKKELTALKQPETRSLCMWLQGIFRKHLMKQITKILELSFSPNQGFSVKSTNYD